MSQPLTPGPLPLYHQLKQVIWADIERGQYKPGDRLPSEAEMIQLYGVSRITVRQALSELEAEGVVVRRHGRGTYVKERNIEQELVRLTDFVEDMQLAGLVASSRVLQEKRVPASPEIAAALRIPTGDEISFIERLRIADGRPIALDMTWLPLRFGLLLNGVDLSQNTIYSIMETRYSIPIETGIFHITATTATSEQAQLLDVSSGAALLLMRRVSYTTGNVPVYVQDRYYRTDRVSYRIMLRRHGNGANGTPFVEELRPIFGKSPTSPTTPPYL